MSTWSISSVRAPARAPGLLAEWRVGAILEAIAVRDPRGGQLWLDIAGQRHPARVASGDVSGPKDGERLQLRVLRNSPVLALETIATQSTESSAQSAVIADALRKFVPRQQSPALLLANLAWIAQRKSGVETLPRAVVQAAAHLWHALPEADSLEDPAALEAAIARSGVFLESNLAAHRGPPDPRFGSDLKTLLLALNRALQTQGAKPSSALTDDAMPVPVPTARGPLTALPAAPATLALLDEPTQQVNELARQADGTLARLTTVQISNSAPDPAVQSMLIDLPVRHEDRAAVLRLKIERDGSRRREGDGSGIMDGRGRCRPRRDRRAAREGHAGRQAHRRAAARGVACDRRRAVAARRTSSKRCLRNRDSMWIA